MPKGDINEAVNAKKTREQRVEAARKAGKQSGRKKMFAKRLKEAYMNELLKEKPKKDGTTTNGFEAVAVAIVNAAVRGNIQAARELAHILGEDIQRFEVSGDVPVQIVDTHLD